MIEAIAQDAKWVAPGESTITVRLYSCLTDDEHRKALKLWGRLVVLLTQEEYDSLVAQTLAAKRDVTDA